MPEKEDYDEETDNIYDDKEVEESVEQDEMEPEEAGFMEGYNKKQSMKKKDAKDIIEEK